MIYKTQLKPNLLRINHLQFYVFLARKLIANII